MPTSKRRSSVASARVTPQDIRRDVATASALRAVEELRRAALAFETEFADALSHAPSVRRESLRNLLHYLAVRRHDVREVQYMLARLGLSSLGRMESHVLASLNAVLEVLLRLGGRPVPPEVREPPPIDFDTGRAVLTEHAIAVLGAPPQHGPTRIMVTLPSEASTDATLVADLVGHGMQIARINGAHDDAAAWAAMVRNVRAAARRNGKRCLVSFDLAGPKLRINTVAPGPAAARWHPRRDAFGKVIEPANVVLAAPGADAPAGSVPVDAALVRGARAGDAIEFTDNRGRERSLEVREATRGALVCTADATAYVRPGTELTLRRRGKRMLRGAIGDIAPQPGSVTLEPGDMLDLVLGDAAGRDAVRDGHGTVVEPAFVSCAFWRSQSSAGVMHLVTDTSLGAPPPGASMVRVMLHEPWRSEGHPWAPADRGSPASSRTIGTTARYFRRAAWSRIAIPTSAGSVHAERHHRRGGHGG